MSDHYHYDYADTHHDHDGAYSDPRHEHGYYDLAGVAEEHHRHADLENEIGDATRVLQNTIAALSDTVDLFGEIIDDLRDRVLALEQDSPQARQREYEKDAALADRLLDE